MTHRMKERNPNGQVKIKRRTHETNPQQISNGHNNVKYMTYRMVKSNPNGQYKIKHRTHRINIKTYPGWT